MFVRYEDVDSGVYFVELNSLFLDTRFNDRIDLVLNGVKIYEFDLTDSVAREMLEKFEETIPRILKQNFFDLSNYLNVLKQVLLDEESEEYEDYYEEEDE